jgi:hypothetical protein
VRPENLNFHVDHNTPGLLNHNRDDPAPAGGHVGCVRTWGVCSVTSVSGTSRPPVPESVHEEPARCIVPGRGHGKLPFGDGGNLWPHKCAANRKRCSALTPCTCQRGVPHAIDTLQQREHPDRAR